MFVAFYLSLRYNILIGNLCLLTLMLYFREECRRCAVRTGFFLRLSPEAQCNTPAQRRYQAAPFPGKEFWKHDRFKLEQGEKSPVCCLAGVLLPFAVSAAESSGSVSTDVAFLWRNYRMECQAVIGFFVLFFLLLIGMVVYMIRFRAAIHRRRQDEREFRRRIYLERDRSNQALLTLEQTAKMANLAYFSCRADGSELTLSAGANRNWPLEDSKAVPPSQWVYPEDLASFEASWQELTQGRSPEIEISFRAGQGGRTLFPAAGRAPAGSRRKGSAGLSAAFRR